MKIITSEVSFMLITNAILVVIVTIASCVVMEIRVIMMMLVFADDIHNKLQFCDWRMMIVSVVLVAGIAVIGVIAQLVVRVDLILLLT